MSEVLTKDELKDNRGKKPPVVKKTEKKPEKKKPSGVTYELPFAQMGESVCPIDYVFGIVDNKEDRQVKLENKRYKIPDDMPEEEKEKLKAALKKAGFVDVTYIKGAKVDKYTGKYIYKAVHPEQTDRNNITGNMALVLRNDDGKPMYDANGKQITKSVKVESGIVTTDDKLVYEALLSSGFLDCGKREIEEDEKLS